MKKLLAFAAVVLSAVTLCFAACAPKTEGEVTFVALSSGADVLANDEIDYFVVPEPAASARIKATANSDQKLNLVGDLQKLYGEAGYPQAVVVAKNELLSGNALSYFTAALKSNAEWLAAETTEISAIVNAVKGNLTEGLTPTFNANNLTKEVISRCGIKFTEANSDKEEVKSFLTALKGVQPEVKDDPADGFFFNGVYPDTSSNLSSLSVYAPDGAPALALAGLMAGEVETASVAQSIDYNIVDATTIQTYVTGAAPKADICILPVNLAAKLLGGGEKYTMLGTVTHGNLYILSAKTDEQITSSNVTSLSGKRVGVVNLAAVPGLTFKLILNKYGIEYSE